MFRPLRPAFENLEKREVFSAGPLGLAAAAQPQGIIHPISDFAIESNAKPLSTVANSSATSVVVWIHGGALKAAPESTPPVIQDAIDSHRGHARIDNAYADAADVFFQRLGKSQPVDSDSRKTHEFPAFESGVEKRMRISDEPGGHQWVIC